MKRLLGLAAALIVAGCPRPAPQGEWVVLGPSPDPVLWGTWENPATGHVVTFRPGGREVLHKTESLCVVDDGVVPEYALYRLGAGAERLELQYYDYRSRPELLQAPQVFQRIGGPPEGCLTSRDLLQPGDLVSAVIRTFDQFYAFFEVRSVDWEMHRSTALERGSQVSNDTLAFEVLRGALGPLHDGHVNLSGVGRSFNSGSPRLRRRLADAWQASGGAESESAFVSSWHQSVLESVYPLLDDDNVRSAVAGALEWSTMRDSIGYLRINRFSGFTTTAQPRPAQYDSLEMAMDSVRSDLDGATILIVDVALNGGGSDAAALLIASYFADGPRTALVYEARGAPDQVIRIAPARAPESRPVLLVTSEVTASAAESFVLMMRAFPHVRQVGGATRGGLSSLLPKPFPNGFRATLSYQRVLDHEGRLYEGSGIPPHCELSLFPDGSLHDGFAAALAQLASGDSCVSDS